VSFLDAAIRKGLMDRGAAWFNGRRYFEAHEDWEAVWNEAVDPQRRWLQGMIQVAAAFVHFERGFHASGFVKLMRGAAEKTAGFAGDTEGLDFARFERDLAPWHEHARRVEAGAPLRDGAPPLPVLHHLPGVVPSPLPPEEAVP
jgi:hypothetical protein